MFSPSRQPAKDTLHKDTSIHPAFFDLIINQSKYPTLSPPLVHSNFFQKLQEIWQLKTQRSTTECSANLPLHLCWKWIRTHDRTCRMHPLCVSLLFRAFVFEWWSKKTFAPSASASSPRLPFTCACSQVWLRCMHTCLQVIRVSSH